MRRGLLLAGTLLCAACGKPPDDPMALIPAGESWMGSAEGQGLPDERPRHKVFLKEFLIDRHEVTYGAFQPCVAARACRVPEKGGPCRWGKKGEEREPMNCVDWANAAAFCAWAGKRLPTEAEWERAARGGKDTKYDFGDDAGRIDEFAWWAGNAGMRTHPVGLKAPNPYGLFDMTGNVKEWTADWYGADYYSKSPSADPPGPASGVGRVHRGCSWAFDAEDCRPSMRGKDLPGYDDVALGFRCARSR